MNATRSPIGEIREEDIPGAIQNPSGSSEGNGAMKKINKTPTVRPDLTGVNPETENIGDWARKDSQFQRALDLLKTFRVFKGGEGSPST